MGEPMENVESLREIFDEVFALLESLETQDIAVLQFLKDEGIASDEKLAPYLEQAGNASNVKWRAARARMDHLLAPIPHAAKEAAKEATEKRQTDKALDESTERFNDSTGDKKHAESATPGKVKREREEGGKETAAENGESVDHASHTEDKHEPRHA